jgi:hypothetical protein
MHGRSVWALAESVAATPPAGLRERVVRRAWAARAARSPFALFFRPVPALVPIAILALLIVSLAGLATARRDADTYGRALAGVANGSVAALAPTSEAPRARGSLVVPASGQPYLVLDLPPAPAGRAWQAWILRGDRPIPAGLADPVGAVVTIRLIEALSPGDGVAVTLEDSRGADRPTTAPVLTGRVS